MAKVQDGQNDFSGGSNNRVVGELIGPTQYIESENAEIRELEIRTRRGSYRSLLDQTGDVQGAGIFRLFGADQTPETILVAQDHTMFRIALPEESRVELPFVSTAQADNVEMIQALDFIYFFRGELNPVQKWDGNETSSLEDLVPPASPLVIMSGSDRVLYEYNRFWVITDRDTIRISDLLSEAFDPNFNFLINQGKDNERVVALFPFGSEGSLIAFKERSIAVIRNASNFTTITQLQQDFIDKIFGCIAKDSIVGIGNDIWALSRHGVISINRTIQDTVKLISEPVSGNVPDYINRINFPFATDSQAVWHDNYYLLAVPIDASETNNAILVFDFLTRAFVGFWLAHDVKKFIVSKVDNKDTLQYVNYSGGIIELQTGLYEDFVRTHENSIQFRDASSTQTVDVTPVLSGTDEINTQTKGKILISTKILTMTDGSIFFATNVGVNTDYIRLYIETNMLKAELVDGGVIQWAIQTAALPLDQFVMINLFQNGTIPQIAIDGVIIPQSFTTSTDLTKWFDDLALDDMRIGSNDTQGGGAISPADSFDGDIEFLTFTGDTGLDDIKATFPINEGSGTTINDDVNNKTGTFGAAPKDPDFSPAGPAPDDIVFKLISRDYTFETPDLEKRITRGEITFAHRRPKISVVINGDTPFDTKDLITDKIYDQTKFYIHGKDDFVLTPNGNINFDHDDPYREDYAPLLFNAEPNGVEFPADSATPDGLTFEEEQEHSELFQGIIITTRANFEITNTQGTVRIKSLLMQANSKAFAGKRSMSL